MRILLLTIASLLLTSITFAQQLSNNASKNETLVAVYSYSGNTKHVAQQIQKVNQSIAKVCRENPDSFILVALCLFQG